MRKKSIKRSIGFLTLILFFSVWIPGCFHKEESLEKDAADEMISSESDAYSDAPTQYNEPFDIDRFYADLPVYTGDPFIPLNDNKPLFTDQDIQSIKNVEYSDLDELGRCGPAVGLIGLNTIPAEERGQIGMIKPTGWHTVRYDDRIEDRYLYNRCHLIGYQLAGTNADPRNLITGTRYLNMTSMLPFENAIMQYITDTGNHVIYRVTPVFDKDNLVASGVFLEAYSVEDEGHGIQFFMYLFNVQPGVIIDYKTGDSQKDETYAVSSAIDEEYIVFIPEQDADPADTDKITTSRNEMTDEEITYVLNINTMRFHDPSCPSVNDIKPKNIAYTADTREELIELGYIPCGRCNP